MVALIDARPPGLDILYRAGTTLTVELTWPTGSLTGRTFTSTLGVVPLDVSIVGDVMTIEASATITGAFTAGAPWLLLEELGGSDPEPVLVGTWTPSTSPAALQASEIQLTDGVIEVDVSALGAGPLASGREIAGPSEQEANSAGFTASIGSFQVEDVLTSGGATYHEITIPEGGLRPVWIELDTSVQQTVAGAAVALALAPSDTDSPTLITATVQSRVKTLPATGRNEHLAFRFRLPAGEGGSYKIMGGVTSGTGIIAASALGPSILSAIEH